MDNTKVTKVIQDLKDGKEVKRGTRSLAVGVLIAAKARHTENGEFEKAGDVQNAIDYIKRK